MEYPVTGLHHITLCAGGAQDDVDFFTGVVGQRLIKQTVLFDGRYAHYHLYYSNAGAEPGSVTTSFPYNRVPGRQGSGQISSTGYTVPKGTLKFWVDHLNHH
jgi:glyoxalase family protein